MCCVRQIYLPNQNQTKLKPSSFLFSILIKNSDSSCFHSLIFWLCARVFVGLLSLFSHTHLSKNCPRVLCVCLVFFSEKNIHFLKEKFRIIRFSFFPAFFFDSKLHSTKREREREMYDVKGKIFIFLKKRIETNDAAIYST